MRIGRNTLNNMMLDNQRRSPLYQAIITDLAITGNLSKEDAEMLLGYEIPDFLHTPDGKTITEYNPVAKVEAVQETKAEAAQEAKPAAKKRTTKKAE